MPTLRGERFIIEDDVDNIAPESSPLEQRNDGFAATGVLGEILERSSVTTIPPTAPSAKVSISPGGWPLHKKRYVKKSSQKQPKVEPAKTELEQSLSFADKEKIDIDLENNQKLASMSAEQIEEERRELLENLDPKLAAMFFKRANKAQKDDLSDDNTPAENPRRRLSSGSHRRVSFAIPDAPEEAENRRGSAESHSVPPPSSNPLDLPVLGPAGSTQSWRTSSSARKVSFSLPEEEGKRPVLSTASSHSVPGAPVIADSPLASSQDTGTRPSVSDRKVSFSIPDYTQKTERVPSATSHSIPPTPPLNAVSDAQEPLIIHKRLDSGDQKVSFSLPDSNNVPQESSAISHSVPQETSIPENSELENFDISNAGNKATRPQPVSNDERKVSFSLPTTDSKEKDISTASSHSVSAPPITPPDGVFKTPKKPEKPSRRTSSIDRKVSFSLPSSQNHEDKSTAATHSVPPTPPASTEPITTEPPSRPSQNDRRVSFATQDDEDDDDRKSTASHHSLPPTPQFDPVPDTELTQNGVHFPRPNDVPELDPRSDTFLTDLHEKYFPNLAHDPSKLDWMKPIDPEESQAYDPSQETIHPKDIRFSFKGEIIPPSKAHTLSTNLGLHHHADAPDAAGYTIKELAHLARSSYPGQRCIAFQTLGRILYRLGSGEFGNEKNVKKSGKDGQRALLAISLWDEVAEGRVIDTLTAESKKERGHQTSIALAQEAVWNWQRGGGKVPEVQTEGGASSR